MNDYLSLAHSLTSAYASQLHGKPYDQALLGRLQANATFSESHAQDKAQGISHLLDLSPLLQPSTDCIGYLSQILEQHSNDAKKAINYFK
jgi:hypothetical protein